MREINVVNDIMIDSSTNSAMLSHLYNITSAQQESQDWVALDLFDWALLTSCPLALYALYYENG